MMEAPMQPATNYWRAIEIEEVIRHGLPDGRGLDLGCGDGHLMSIVLSHVGRREFVGIDLDPKETAMASWRKVYSAVETGTAEHLPFADSSFEVVFSNSVLEHIPEIESVLSEVARVLRTGGRFLFTVPGPDFHECLAGSIFVKREAYLHEIDARCAHLRYWSAADWSRHLEGAGFRVVYSRDYMARNQLRRWETIAWYTSGLLYRIFGKKNQPIEIQRMASLRAPKLRLSRPLACLGALFLSIGVNFNSAPFGGLLIEAEKICSPAVP
jgi:ubiquinone/menaquinone biosynthesis C-methylase UbiE